MATTEKIPGKNGDTYRITVYSGYDTSGKRIRHRTLWKPAPGMDSPPDRKGRTAGRYGL